MYKPTSFFFRLKCKDGSSLSRTLHRCFGYLFKEPDDILADLRQPDDDIVHEDVVQGGVISALPPGLRQNQVPAVHRGK